MAMRAIKIYQYHSLACTKMLSPSDVMRALFKESNFKVKNNVAAY